ncbi:DHS-like NAD/FAD-binding domain-containing protein [Massariosphaeria phaeospora]|uniref:DHS-like NAD/FAD-binding domain-containing protein n=1 Tax=Massariosphaeria phaeospora TaxID=100035 RepID=A0A7C8MCB6_9PLEO|nr:DHS-like NAD/FAD-binding domain-containing protein [Massariosphaeria phaeospora]
MAASSYSGPVMVQEAAPPPAVDAAINPTGESAYEAATAKTSHMSAEPEKDDDEAEEWESTSLYEEILDEAGGFDYSTDGKDACTADEARFYRKRLREDGASQFVLDTITQGKISARKLCTAFGVKIPKFMNDFPDESFYQLLGLAISRELNKRLRLEQYRNLDDAAQLLRERKNIMVITGAGISTSLGIPDFRSKNTGFYSKLLEMGYEEPEQVFDLQNFDDDPRTFYKLAGDIIPDLKKWSPTHEFIRLLQDKDKLLTNYTQNIDNVESHAGIRKEKLIQCHGSWAGATCRKCKYKVPGEEIFDAVRDRTPAVCTQCIQEIAANKSGMKRKRSSNGSKKKRGLGDDDSDSDGAYDIPQPGIMKPDITFFGEQLPNDFFDRLKDVDKDKVDLVIVMGTSMKVAPVSEIPNFLPRDVPQIYISRDPIHHINFDINLLGDCDVVVAELARRAGWELKHHMLPEKQEVEVTIINEHEHTHGIKARDSVA